MNFSKIFSIISILKRRANSATTNSSWTNFFVQINQICVKKRKIKMCPYMLCKPKTPLSQFKSKFCKSRCLPYSNSWRVHATLILQNSQRLNHRRWSDQQFILALLQTTLSKSIPLPNNSFSFSKLRITTSNWGIILVRELRHPKWAKVKKTSLTNHL